jgi:mxaK protein
VRRAYGHLAFGVVALGCGLLTAAQLVRLEHADRVNTAIASASASTTGFEVGSGNGAAAKAGPSFGDRATVDTGTDVNVGGVASLPEARLARAVALSKVDYDAALAAYKAIIQADRSDLRQIALYDLGNLHLRQALKNSLDDAAQSLPLTELAKQSYRDALRKNPADWDARYNLERALRAAPEEEESGEEAGPPDPKEHQRSTLADPRMDLP